MARNTKADQTQQRGWADGLELSLDRGHGAESAGVGAKAWKVGSAERPLTKNYLWVDEIHTAKARLGHSRCGFQDVRKTQGITDKLTLVRPS